MPSQVTKGNLDGFAHTLETYYLETDLAVEHTASGWTLYAERGSVELLFGRTKAELFDLMHAFAHGLRVGIGDESIKPKSVEVTR
jgi:hypothetical protein